ncbi:hypothetical protein HMPREF1432_01380 [Helicobacter pylori GAMchJs114i]|nr:hypothetical protein HMPREF1432_01380 [Helicobacter pylori GAMchJs114i]
MKSFSQCNPQLKTPNPLRTHYKKLSLVKIKPICYFIFKKCP